MGILCAHGGLNGQMLRHGPGANIPPAAFSYYLLFCLACILFVLDLRLAVSCVLCLFGATNDVARLGSWLGEWCAFISLISLSPIDGSEEASRPHPPTHAATY